MTILRRAFLVGIAGVFASGYAPAFVGSNVLMPVRKLMLGMDIGDASGDMSALWRVTRFNLSIFVCLGDTVRITHYDGEIRDYAVLGSGVLSGTMHEKPKFLL